MMNETWSRRCAQLLSGLTTPLRAARFLLSHRSILPYAILPWLANAVVFACLFCVWVFWLVPHVDLDRFSPSWMGALGPLILNAVKWVLGLALYGLVSLYGFTAIGLIVAGPFNDILSEKVQQVLCVPGDPGRVPWKIVLKQLALILAGSVRIFLWQMAITIVAWPLLFIPVVGAIPLFLVAAYFEGWGFLSVPLGRHLMRSRHRWAGLRDRRWEILGMGASMSCLLTIPFLGLFVLPLGVTAATLLFCEVDWAGRFESQKVPPPPGFFQPRLKQTLGKGSEA